jgi:single-strand DNA-binding protein
MTNVVVLIGNVASDPKIRTTGMGRSICSFRIAVSRPGGDEADCVEIVAWERQAAVCNEYLQVGRRISVEGRLHVTDSKAEVVAHRVQLLGSAPKSAVTA